MPFMWTQSCHFPGNSVNQGLGAISQSTIAVLVASFREHRTERQGRQGHNYSQKDRPRHALLFSSAGWPQGQFFVRWGAPGAGTGADPGHTGNFLGQGLTVNSHGKGKLP